MHILVLGRGSVLGIRKVFGKFKMSRKLAELEPFRGVEFGKNPELFESKDDNLEQPDSNSLTGASTSFFPSSKRKNCSVHAPESPTKSDFSQEISLIPTCRLGIFAD